MKISKFRGNLLKLYTVAVKLSTREIMEIVVNQVVNRQFNIGISNDALKFSSARKIWPLLDLLAKIGRVLACLCFQNFRSCSHGRILEY